MIADDIIQEAEWIMDQAGPGAMEHIGSGLYKDVYMLPSGSAVVKVRSQGGLLKGKTDMLERSFELEWALYVLAQEMGYGKFLPETVWSECDRYGLYMIQEVCDVHDEEELDCDETDDMWDFVEEFGICDIHEENVGTTVFGHRWVVVDWGFDMPNGFARDVLKAIDEGKPIIDCY